MSEFIEFDDADADRPGIVVLGEDDGDWDGSFWHIILDRAWEDEWFLNDATKSAEVFVGKERVDVNVEWQSYVLAHVTPPHWRWYVWLDVPEGEYDEGSQILEPAASGDHGAFRAAAVVLK